MNEVVNSLEALIIQKSNNLLESTSSEELAALAELVQSYARLKEISY